MSRSIFAHLSLWILLSLQAVGVSAALPIKADGEPLPSLAPMLNKTTPSVVNISTKGTVRMQQNPLFNDPFFRRFFDIPSMPRERKTQSLGSGVIVDAEEGLVLTNNHVIANADEITVTLRDGREFAAELQGTDPETDVAVIKIPAEDLDAIKMADSDDLQVGDFVVAIGNPFGLGQTVTSGIVSALARSGLSILGYEDFIQTDASINPGNSGGALVNLNGELVGINTAIFSQAGGNIGIGFAIPINLAMQVMEQLLEYGEVKRAFIGVQVQDLTPPLAEAFGIDEQNQSGGAVIVDVLDDSPASKAGLKSGDVVLGMNDRRVENAGQLRNAIGLLRVGEEFQLEILRDGKSRQYSLETVETDESVASTGIRNELLQGITLEELDEEHPRFGNVMGVRVTALERDSRAWASGLREGDVITSVNRQPIRGMNDFLQLVDGQQGPLLLRILRGNSAAFLVIN
ncbi:MAG: DegQ family serine endoprotease [Gammaproteobacteria bacterium]